MIVASIVVYGVLLVAPEPISKVIAATMTAALVVCLGVDTLYSLHNGWRRLIARTDAATAFDELRSAGEQFGKLMGANTARILVMVAVAAMGSGTGGSNGAQSAGREGATIFETNQARDSQSGRQRQDGHAVFAVR